MWSSRKLSPDVRAALSLERGERVLAVTEDGTGNPLVGTRYALYVFTGERSGNDAAAGVRRIPWEGIEHASWDKEAGALRIQEVAEFGAETPVTALAVSEPEPLLQLVRERVTASIVYSQPTAVGDGKSVRVVARRRPGSDHELSWSVVFDDGLDPNEPWLRELADRALTEARGQVGA